ncbi:MAG: methyl-accepting chemotaxis protein [Spirochaetes bacterium]|nr:methyl-accepting chemotaxis protein [Spirochaetota bacterium]
MAKTGKLTPVIGLDNDKCINCYACITGCPVKFCMDGSGDKLTIDHDRCIACGNCISVCRHGARLPLDDLELFDKALQRGERLVAIVAPAVVSVFGADYLKLNGFLKSLGVQAVFDVSFGAELTVASYLDYMKEKKPKMVISQPCPAVVNFIEIYHPELLPFLAPAHSPMLHTVKMIKEYYPEYSGSKVLAISPCLAKKREFEETAGCDYNVTMLALKNMLEVKKIRLENFPALEYDGPKAERAVLFPVSGGLLETAERFAPGIKRASRKIEGIHSVYHYLEGVAKDLNKPGVKLPVLIDCLNCELGCIGGPGTGNSEKTLDELESPVRERSQRLEAGLNPKSRQRLYAKYNKSLERYWKPGLYSRDYRDLSGNFALKRPGDRELDEIYKGLKKTSKADIYDCTACGYGSCEKMATAIFNKLNKPGNCAHYNLALLNSEKKAIKEINEHFNTNISRAISGIETLSAFVEKLNSSISSEFEAVGDAASVTEKIVSSIKSVSEISVKEQSTITGLIEKTAKGQCSMLETAQAVDDVSKSVDGIVQAIKIISVIAANTKLLAMNAAIESAHAGDAGRGFAVVADEIRRLSESTAENSRNISQTLSDIIGGIAATAKRTGDTGDLIKDVSKEINGFAATVTDLIDTLGKISAESSDITGSLNMLKESSATVKDDYGEMRSLLGSLRQDMDNLAAMSQDIARAAEVAINA